MDQNQTAGIFALAGAAIGSIPSFINLWRDTNLKRDKFRSEVDSEDRTSREKAVANAQASFAKIYRKISATETALEKFALFHARRGVRMEDLEFIIYESLMEQSAFPEEKCLQLAYVASKEAYAKSLSIPHF